MRVLKSVSIGLLALIIASCATSYQPYSIWTGGGFSDARLAADSARVDFAGNANTPKSTVKNYMLYRCAELTNQYGYDYFIIVSGGTTPRFGSVTLPGSYTETVKSKDKKSTVVEGEYHPAQTYTTTSYTASVVIKMYHGKKPENVLRAHDAKELLRYLGPSISNSR